MGLLRQLRQQIADRLAADSYFEDIPVLTEDRGDVENEIARALGTLTETGGKIGICAVVLTPFARIRTQELPGPYLDPLQLSVTIEENVLVNQATGGTQKHCSDVAERVATLLHKWLPDGHTRPVLVSGNGISVVEPVIGTLAYAVALSFAAGLSVSLDQVATPTANPDGGVAPQTVTLACATAGAAIFYTIDGKFPSPTVGTLYTAPFEVAAACTLKAAAFLAGYLTSEVKQSVFT